MNKISLEEFKRRHTEARRKINERKLDALLVHSDEAEFANVRYFSDYWPIFESAGVFIPAEGDATLLIGPESETFARDHSVIKDIKKILYYRESAEPNYPGITLDKFEDIFKSANNGKGVKRLGVAGYTAMPVTIYEAMRQALPNAEIIRADDIMYEMRMIKSEPEIAMLREAFRISDLAVADVLDHIRPGMTELQAVGLAQESFYRNGAEYEAHPTYVLSGPNSSHAIGRPGHRVIQQGDLVQLNIGARVGGYSPSIGVPICMGKMDAKMRDLVAFGLEAHVKTMEWMKAGVPAGTVAASFFEFVKKRGYEKNLLYGPCHGLGMMEVERPWMETTSTYPLRENMTFQVDTFLYCPQYGLRWETGARITASGVEAFSGKFRKIIEIA
ncbi:MAG: Xaa-Pro peptidase family protein [Kiritimatiellae bacterium]|nr:Xaa-Pro peptidase family protein [Kiritimatiellia bacterium]